MKTSRYVFIFCLAFLFYAISAGIGIAWQSSSPQYVYLAYAFLHGKLNLIELPKSVYDLIFYQGNWYVPGALAPALLLMPVVAIAGLGTSDILFNVVVGAFNVVLMYALLLRLKPGAKQSLPAWLSLLFTAGTAHWWVTSLGSVWFNAQIVAVMFMLLFVNETIGEQRPWLAGFWLGMAALARPTTMFAAIFYLVYIFLRKNEKLALSGQIISFGAVFGSVLLIIPGYNALRFGNPLDFGYLYVQGNETLVSVYAQYGGFNLKFIPCNVYISIFGLPYFLNQPVPGTEAFCKLLTVPSQMFTWFSPFFNPLGMSIFLTTPAFLYIFKARSRNPLTLAAWAGLFAVCVPLWMYHNTGFVQFGYRYSLDVVVFLFILLTAGLETLGRLEKSAILASVLMNALGLSIMFNIFYNLTWTQMWLIFGRLLFHQ